MKKVQFKSSYSQYLFLAPQLGILLIFLYWPIIQTFRDAFTMQDAFGFGATFVWFDNFLFIFDDPAYWILLPDPPLLIAEAGCTPGPPSITAELRGGQWIWGRCQAGRFQEDSARRYRRHACGVEAR